MATGSSSPWSGACGYCQKAATQTRSKTAAWSATSPPPSSTHKPPGSSSSTPPRASCGGTPNPQLTRPAEGLAGNLTARAEAHTIRFALLYALLDGQRRIQPQHLKAALALWDYAARSAAWALESTAGDPLAHQIHAALKHALPDGLTRTQLRDMLHRNVTTTQLDQALAALAQDGKITSHRVLTNGRPAELWTATHS